MIIVFSVRPREEKEKTEDIIMNLGFGFHTGVNRVMRSRIDFWRRNETGEFSWHAYLWRLSYSLKIIGYTNDWVEVVLRSWEDRGRLYELSVNYDEEIDGNNYRISMESQLWESHHRRAEENMDVLKKLMNEPMKNSETNSVAVGREV